MATKKAKPKTTKAIKEKLIFLQRYEQSKVSDQAYHINRFTKEQRIKITQDYYWLKGATETLEWVLGERKSI